LIRLHKRRFDMSGLILAGIGQGIARAGDAYGNAMMRQLEEDRRDSREEAREARKLQAAEAREEQLRQRMISETAAAREGADEIARGRLAGQVQGFGSQVAGDSPVMERDEIDRLLRENPEYEQVYRRAGLIEDSMDPRAQRAADEYEAAVGAGAHSSVLDAIDKKRKAVMDLIREETKEKQRLAEREDANRRFDQNERRLDILDKNATTNQTRAETTAQGRAATQERLTTIINSQERVLGRLGNSPPRIRGATPEQQEAANREWENDRREAMELIRDARRELRKNFQEEPPQPRNSGDNTQTTRPPLNSFVRQ
jgi:hypothetical protein